MGEQHLDLLPLPAGGDVVLNRGDPLWVQVSVSLYGQNKHRSRRSMLRSDGASAGYGGHVRAVQGFRYVEGV